MQSELDQVDHVIETLTRALPWMSDNDPNKRVLLIGLAKAHDRRFDLRDEPDDIRKVVEYRAMTLVLTPDNDPDLPDLFSEIGIAHSRRFQRLSNIEDMENAIEYKSLAVELIPKDDPDFTRQLANLSVSYKDRFKQLGKVGDIEKAIEYDSQVVAMTPKDHWRLPDWLKTLGTSHSIRFERFGELKDLESAIKFQSRALDLTPDDHPELASCIANLAVSHNHRFKRLGKLSDIEHAIKYYARALALIADENPDLPTHLANLASFHKDRFQRLGELTDLEQAIKHQSRALALSSDDHPHFPSHLSNLSTFHQERFKLLGELSDLEEAATYDSLALNVIPDDHPLLSTYLANLAMTFKNRFEHLGELTDLEQAIKYEARALGLTPDNHPHLPSRLAKLAMSHRYRFQLLSEVGDLEHAIEYESRALAEIAQDHPESCVWHFQHALSYISYYNYSHDPCYLQQSLSLLRKACISTSGPPRDRFRIARDWAFHATEHSALNPIEAYQATIDLLPQFIWLGAPTEQRYLDLKSIEALSVDAAYAAIVSLEYSLALEWLEQTRCVVWNQNLVLRSPLDRLLTSHPEIAASLQIVANKLHFVTSNSRESQALSLSLTPEEVAQDHRSLAKEYEDLLAQARIQPNFEDFLLPVKARHLARAARDGPIVVINCHQDRCDALVVLPQQDHVAHVPLPNFNADKARAARSELRVLVEGLRLPERGNMRRPIKKEGEEHEMGNMLAVLWVDVVKPVLDHLCYITDVSTSSLPHITWCPTGAMTFLPLHAAGDYNQPRSRVFDYVISSYTPTLATLLQCTPYKLSPDSRVLAVGQAATPGHAPLPGTLLELSFVEAHMKAKVEYTQLVDGQATVTAVLDEMERHDWVHLACHAHQNVDDPKKSGFFLCDGVLDLDEINRRSFKNKGLAFLSACQTAMGDETLADEAVHLASGMLMAGYSSVIATMWSVGDDDAPFVADKVYSQLMEKGTLGNGEAGRALHDAVKSLRERVEEEEFGRWVPFIHIGS